VLYELQPPGLTDALRELVVLDHVGRLQIFVGDVAIYLRQLGCFPVMEVASLVGDVLLRPGRRLHRFGAAVAALLAARNAAQAAAQIGFRLAVIGRSDDLPPLARVAKDSRPTSMPVSWPGGGSGRMDISAQEIATYQPSTSLEIVIVLGVPSIGRLHRMPTRPILDRIRKPLSSRAPLPNSLKVKEWKRFFP
jgi:hypothetical protein